MVGDDDRLADRPVGVQAAGRVCQYRGTAPGGHRSTHPVDHRVDRVALVEVGPAAQDQRRHLAHPHRPGQVSVTLHSGRRETGKVGHLHVGHHLAETVGGVRPAGAQHDDHVVAAHAGALGERGGGPMGESEGVGFGHGRWVSAGSGGISGVGVSALPFTARGASRA